MGEGSGVRAVQALNYRVPDDMVVEQRFQDVVPVLVISATGLK